jgi:hypothetical protein
LSPRIPFCIITYVDHNGRAVQGINSLCLLECCGPGVNGFESHWKHGYLIFVLFVLSDRLCGLVVRVPVYRPRVPVFDSRRYQGLSEVVGLQQGQLSLVTTIEEVLGRKSNDTCLDNQHYGRGDPFRWPRYTLYSQKLALTAPTNCDRSVGIVRSRAKDTQFFFVFLSLFVLSCVDSRLAAGWSPALGVLPTIWLYDQGSVKQRPRFITGCRAHRLLLLLLLLLLILYKSHMHGQQAMKFPRRWH